MTGIFHCVRSSAVSSYGIADYQIAVIRHPTVASLDCRFVVYADNFRRNYYVVIKSGIVFFVCVDVIRKIRLYANQLYMREACFYSANRSRKLSVKVTHRAGVKDFTAIFCRFKDSKMLNYSQYSLIQSYAQNRNTLSLPLPPHLNKIYITIYYIYL